MCDASKPTPKKSPKKRGKITLFLCLSFAVFLVVASLFVLFGDFGEGLFPFCSEEMYVGVENVPDWVEIALISVDGASRRGEKLEGVRDIVLHYVGNPGTSARANRNWFDSPESNTSSHFIVGLEGEVLLCIPLDEKSSASNERNRDTVSIEVCHPDETGEFSPVTLESLHRLLVWLCEEFDLTEENLIRHYDVTGKKCPLYYVEREDEWLALKKTLKENLKKGESDETHDGKTP